MLNPLGLLYVFTSSCFEPKSWDWHWQWQSFYHRNFVWRNKFSCSLQKQMYIPQTLEEQCQMIQRAKTGCSSGQHHIELRLCIVNLESIWTTPCTSKKFVEYQILALEHVPHEKELQHRVKTALFILLKTLMIIYMHRCFDANNSDN